MHSPGLQGAHRELGVVERAEGRVRHHHDRRIEQGCQIDESERRSSTVDAQPHQHAARALHQHGPLASACEPGGLVERQRR
ncbi:hypothetical protein GCM10009551_087750 [Nocardiopsis tropica]